VADAEWGQVCHSIYPSTSAASRPVKMNVRDERFITSTEVPNGLTRRAIGHALVAARAVDDSRYDVTERCLRA